MKWIGTERGGALSIGIQNAVLEGMMSNGANALLEPSFWYAIQTKSRHEKKVHAEICEKGIHSFLPLHREKRRWSDRSQWVELPLFSQYLFVRVPSFGDSRVRVLQTVGVLQFVGEHGRGTPIPDEQIENLHAIVSRGIPAVPHQFLRVGEKVRVRGGALEGIEGILSAIHNDKSLIISVDLIQKSVAIRIDGFEIEPV